MVNLIYIIHNPLTVIYVFEKGTSQYMTGVLLTFPTKVPKKEDKIILIFNKEK